MITPGEPAERPRWEAIRETAFAILALVKHVESRHDFRGAQELWQWIEALSAEAQELDGQLAAAVETTELLTAVPEPAKAVRETQAILAEARQALDMVLVHAAGMQAMDTANQVAIQGHWDRLYRQQHLTAQSANMSNPVLPPENQP